MSEQQKPLYRMCYRHIGGKCFIVWGIAADFKTKDKEIVILSDLDNAEITYVPLDVFFTKAPEGHSKAGQPKFELVTPV